MYLLMKKCVLEVSGRAGQCVRRVGVSALEALARRPRGQQLLRQVDRMLDVGERMARWAAGGDGTTHSTYFPVSAVTMVSLSVVILPTMVVSVIIMSIPVLPFALPLLVFGPIVNLCYDGTISTFLSCFPTPSSTAIAIRRRRRELRAIRYNGVRDMHLVNEGGICDSILAKIFVWWPVAVLAIVGQLMGLGGPYTPSAWALSPLKKGDLEVSPRKRKLYELEIASNEGKQSDTEPEEMQELDVDSDSSDAEEVPDPLETTIMEILSRAVQESDTTVKDDGSAEVEDPDYENISHEELYSQMGWTMLGPEPLLTQTELTNCVENVTKEISVVYFCNDDCEILEIPDPSETQVLKILTESIFDWNSPIMDSRSVGKRDSFYKRISSMVKQGNNDLGDDLYNNNKISTIPLRKPVKRVPFSLFGDLFNFWK